MRNKIALFKESLYSNFWTIPLSVTLLLIIIAFGMLSLDHHLPTLLDSTLIAGLVDPTSAMTILSVIATAVISITSVTFSIIVLIFSILSTQFGHRLLPKFIQKKSTQVVLGLFIGTFVYCLLVLLTISTRDNNIIVPLVSIIVAMSLGIISFFALIYLIHYVCQLIQVGTVLKLISTDVLHSIKTFTANDFAKKIPPRDFSKKSASIQVPPHYTETAILHPADSGYILNIDYKSIFKFAESHDSFIKVLVKPGYFLLKTTKILKIYSNQELSVADKSKCVSYITIGNHRSTVQDIEFAFEQLCEIALIALSPSVNNPYTVIHCLDRIAEALSALADYEVMRTVHFDEFDKPRLVIKAVSYHDIVNAALLSIRLEVKNNFFVAHNMLCTSADLLSLSLPLALHQAIAEQANCLLEDLRQLNLNRHDQAYLEAAASRLPTTGS